MTFSAITVTSAPEPASLAIFALGSVLLLRRRDRLA
jgi:hypothetical protein